MKITIIATLALGLSACATGTAQLVQTTHQGGEVAMEGAYMERVADAMILMASHCDGEFLVLDEHAGAVDAPSRHQASAEFVCTEAVTARLGAR